MKVILHLLKATVAPDCTIGLLDEARVDAEGLNEVINSYIDSFIEMRKQRDFYMDEVTIQVGKKNEARKERDEARAQARRLYMWRDELRRQKEESTPLPYPVAPDGKRLYQSLTTGEWTTDPDNLTDSVPLYRGGSK